MSEENRLTDIIHQRIDSAGGSLPFAQFMQAALYEPGLGYYDTKTVFGEQGDFVTASELGPWLSLAMADLVFDAWQQMGEPKQWTLIEQGSGSGQQMAALLDILSQFSMHQAVAVISVEHCSQLRERQSQLFAERGLDVRLVPSLDEIDAAEHVIYYSNELPDAFPVSCFHYKNGNFFERSVAMQGNEFCWSDADEPMQQAPDIAPELIENWPDSYKSEWNPALNGWQKQLSRVIKSGFIFTVDYGYSHQEYYRQARVEGTLLAHIGQTATDEVLTLPGSSDITAHVDFSALVKAGSECDLRALLWMSQGGWLAQSPSVQSLIQSLAAQNDAVSMHLLAHAKRMLMPYGMGEVFKLLVQSKGIEARKPAYLNQFDHLDVL
ncbi:SAM-dependent methyltransferase [Mariprofundus sp. EBB-1]|uniref:class I SAM-dependent methyltransferase n=1 Tax=Mariprofundus sp. EBB-1 TaxID=2650971 RepID=UPI000EF1F1C6|nr:SAM-dependent methyltransferase [Mariprofundus sp. EBB-1]RLL53289.1 SAM-dependent methyltransferase [Mariprofundus sp. EBB-1]